MTMPISLHPIEKADLPWAQKTVTDHHYLHAPVDPRCSVEGYTIHLGNIVEPLGLLLFGRPEATRCYPWYGSVDDVQTGRAECTRWEVLNLARVWLDPFVQHGGEAYLPDYLPGFIDRKGVFQSTLASDVLKQAISQIGYDYLMRRPPCYLEEPYEIRWLLSYCDTRLHKGTIYERAGFELYRTNKRGIQTWRIPLPGLTKIQDTYVTLQSLINPRSVRYRAKRAQLCFDI
jgi:hypothetical protein